MSSITIEGNITCDHLLNHHPAKIFEVEIILQFDDVSSYKKLKVGDKGVCKALNCDHRCNEIKVTHTGSLLFGIKPLEPKKTTGICTSQPVI